VVVLVLEFGIFLVINGFPGNWELIFQTISGMITIIMLFVIQHTQNRQQVSIQLKLDELIKASPAANNLLVHIEKAPDEELIDLERDRAKEHELLRVGSPE
jgi:low affinity Fe/Cu permease